MKFKFLMLGKNKAVQIEGIEQSYVAKATGSTSKNSKYWREQTKLEIQAKRSKLQAISKCSNNERQPR